MIAVADNDILLKAASYGRLKAFVADYVGNDQQVGYLAAARFMLPKRCLRAHLNGDRAAVAAALTAWFNESRSIEPTEDELQVAARLENAAQKLGVPLHGGESQLCAVVVARNVDRLLTGDKQAIIALHSLMGDDRSWQVIAGRVHCLEMIVEAAIEREGLTKIREAICAEPDVDKALSIIFSCWSPEATQDSIVSGLRSYLSNLKKDAGRVFVKS